VGHCVGSLLADGWQLWDPHAFSFSARPASGGASRIRWAHHRRCGSRSATGPLTAGSNLAELADELRQGGKVPDVPLILLIALATDPGQGLFLSEQRLRELSDHRRAFYAAVAESVPRGEHRVL
jgi:hypothetical protein